jgi:iron complex outermembrane recepter protein
MKKKSLSTVIASVIALSGATTTVLAAEEQLAIEEVLVTSSKRGIAALQNVPTSITAVDQEALDRMGAVGVEDLTRAIPALDSVDAGPGQKQYLIRGINAEGESTVAVLMDNIPQTGGGDSSRRAGNNTPDFDLYDIQQVEVLRGPQGTQYGANSVAGVVRYVTNKPAFEGTEFEVESGISSYDGGETSWNVKSLYNAVLVEDKLAFRGTVAYADNGGYIDNIQLNEDDINSNTRTSLRMALNWQISDNTTLLGQYFYQEIDSEGRTSTSPFDWEESVGPPFMYAEDGTFLGSTFSKGKAGDLKAHSPVQEPYKEEAHTFALTLESDLEWGDLTIATSYVERDQELNLDSSTPWMLHDRFQSTGNCIRTGPCVPGPPFGGTPDAPTVPPIPPFILFSADETIISPTGLVLLQQDQTQESFNFEARFSSTFEGPLNFMAGVFYQDRDQILEPSRVWPADPITGEAIHDPAFLMLDRDSTYNTTQEAIFGELYWDITDSLVMTVGGRAFKTEQTLTGDLRVPFLSNEDIGGPIGHTKVKDDESDSIYKFNLAWNITDDVMIYGTYSEGFRSAGVNNAVVPEIPTFYGSDKTSNVEFGAKTTWLNNTLQANFSVYSIEWEDLQTGVDVTSQFGGLVNAFGDVAEVEGYEIELLWVPIEGLTLSFNYADIDATLTEDLVDAVGQDVVDIVEDGIVQGQDGDSLLGSPDYSGSAFAMYDFSVGSMNAYVRADVQFQSKVRNNNYSESRNTPSRSYELINLRAGLTQNDHWRYALYVRNVTNEVADLTIYNNFQQNDRVTPSAPRTVGFTVNYMM